MLEHSSSTPFHMAVMDQQWTFHASAWCMKLMEAMNQLRQEKALCDTAIMGSDETVVMAHSVVLSACSKHLASIIQTVPNVVKLEYQAETIEQLLSYIYTGRIMTASRSCLTKMSKLAEELQLDVLMKWCTNIDVGESGSEFAEGSEVDMDKKSSTDFDKTTITIENALKQKFPSGEKEGSETCGIRHGNDPAVDNNNATPTRGKEEELRASRLRQTRKRRTLLPSSLSLPCKSLLIEDTHSSAGKNPQLPAQTQHSRGCYACDTCGKVLSSKSALESHVRIHTGQKPFRCQHCAKQFTQRSTLNFHVRAVHQNLRPHKCSMCQKGFKTKYHCNAHERMVHATVREQHECRFCPVVLSSKDSWKSHERRHKNPPKYNCEKCDKSFVYLDTFKNHTLAHLGKKGNRCSVCGGMYRKLGLHMKSHEKHGDIPLCLEAQAKTPSMTRETDKASTSVQTSFQISATFHTAKSDSECKEKRDKGKLEKYPCTTCGKLLASKQGLEFHMRTHTGEKPFRCEECGKYFTQSGSLHLHIRGVHRNERPYKCDQCEKFFRRRGQLTLHQNTVHARDTGEEHCCRFCIKSFPNKISLKLHEEQRHLNVKSYKCELCDQVFKQLATLKVHTLKHLGQSPAQVCDVCGGVFRNIRTHRLVHDKTREKKFQCSFCPKQFFTKTNMVAHERFHTGERPYKCRHCDKAFHSGSLRQRHEMTHTGERPFLCGICGKRCRSSWSLKTHKQIHSDDRPYKCSACGKCFKQQTVLHAHTLIHRAPN